MKLRAELQAIVDGLVRAASAEGVSLDAIGEALGVLAVSQVEIEAMIDAIEAAGTKVIGPQGQNGEGTLRKVLAHARSMRAETGKAPSPAEIAARSGIEEERVRHALALARVIAK